MALLLRGPSSLALQDSGCWARLPGSGGDMNTVGPCNKSSERSFPLLEPQWLQSFRSRKLRVWVPSIIAKNATTCRKRPVRELLSPNPVSLPSKPLPSCSLRSQTWDPGLPPTSATPVLSVLSATPLAASALTWYMLDAAHSVTGGALTDRPSGSRLTGVVWESWFYFQQTCFVYSNLFPLSFGGSDLRLKNKTKLKKPESISKSCLECYLHGSCGDIIICLVADWVNFALCAFPGVGSKQ